MQETITAHLIDTYAPNAIILHGSRARGKAREHSDWDFVLLYSQATTVENGREMFLDQNIEYSIHQLPISDIIDEFGAKLQGAKVLYEKNDEGSTLLQQATNEYAQGVHWTTKRIANHKLWLEGRINGMKDNIDNPVVFNKYYSDFYGRVFNYWYWILQQQHSQPVYIAQEEVAEKDPVYYKLVSTFTSLSTGHDEKVVTGHKIFKRLFSTR